MKDVMEVVVNHRSDMLTQDVILTGMYKYTNFQQFGFSFRFPFTQYKHITGDISYPRWQLEEIEKTELPLRMYKKLVKITQKEQTSYKKYLKSFKKRIKKRDDKIIEEYFQRTLRAVGTIPYFILERGLQKQLKPTDYVPSAETEITKANKALTWIAKQKKRKLIEKHLKKFCERYGYLGMKYYKWHPWTIEEARKMLNGKSEKRESKRRKATSQQAKVAAELLRLRTQKWEINCYGTALFRDYMMRHYKKIPYNDLLFMRMREVEELVQEKHVKKREERPFILQITNKGVILLPDKEVEEKKIHVKVIKGMCAEPGIVRGKVKVLLNAEESNKVNLGDILVATMSTPDFLPAMRKAAAFVTDIGGITSHAAIVSREMKKPCIIGTKIATKVLKDGDIVEVDAVKGTVKKL